MTRTTRKLRWARGSFVGAGPGDPGLLTRPRVLRDAADHVVYDTPARAAARRGAPRGGEDRRQLSPAEGQPGDVAKVLLSAARSGLHAVHLVAGDPFAATDWSRRCRRSRVPRARSRWCPASRRHGVATYAGVPLPGVRTGRRRRRPRARLRRARSRPSARWCCWRSRATPATSPRAAGCSPPASTARRRSRSPATAPATRQYTTSSTVDSFVAAAARLQRAPRGDRVGPVVACATSCPGGRTGPLYGWKVLVPRTKEQAGAMSERLRAYGAIPCEVPTIAVEPPRTPAQMERAIKGLVDGRYAWTIFTSVNAVRAVWEKFAEHGLDARHFGGVKIACIGEATADAVRAFGIQPELVPSGEQSSEGLLAEFSPHDEVSTRWAGCCCRAPTSPPRRWPPA